MNDNLPRHLLRLQDSRKSQRQWLEQLGELREIGLRAVSKPESLTMCEIQEIAWGFMMAAGTLEDMKLSSDPDAT